MQTQKYHINGITQHEFTLENRVYINHEVKRGDFFQANIPREAVKLSTTPSSESFQFTRTTLFSDDNTFAGYFGIIKQSVKFKKPPIATEIAKTLTPREWDVISLYSKGLTAKEVANTLLISRHTVVHHLRSAYEKLGVSNKALALTKLQNLGLC